MDKGRVGADFNAIREGGVVEVSATRELSIGPGELTGCGVTDLESSTLVGVCIETFGYRQRACKGVRASSSRSKDVVESEETGDTCGAFYFQVGGDGCSG